ncbi:methanobactin biosynthesis protein MbnC [Methylocystis bryophila]|uniref:methanobactin biosynthesis protein MbnC n=1 Tax=Methylocystis bryophila TaxID=655015 RepID=UPI00131A0D63|nr:methanobactin biosynthesis protein MbnC [Methylocystis bryophila]
MLGALSRPARIFDYPPESRAFVRIDASTRVYWHHLFDICPRLLEMSPPDGAAIFWPFMAWADECGLTLGWTWYLWVYHWLLQSEFKNRLNEEILLEIMGAAAAGWAIYDKGRNCGVVIGCRDTPNLVAGWKVRTVNTGRQVELLEIEDIPAPTELFGCFFAPDFELKTFPGWEGLSR